MCLVLSNFGNDNYIIDLKEFDFDLKTLNEFIKDPPLLLENSKIFKDLTSKENEYRKNCTVSLLLIELIDEDEPERQPNIFEIPSWGSMSITLIELKMDK